MVYAISQIAEQVIRVTDVTTNLHYEDWLRRLCAGCDAVDLCGLYRYGERAFWCSFITFKDRLALFLFSESKREVKDAGYWPL